MAAKPFKAKIKRTLHNARRAWWVLLIMLLYMGFAWYFLGTSCLFSSITGLPCPGCGVTRAAFSLARGDLSSSLHYHPLLIPGLAIACAYMVLWLTRESMPRYTEKALIIFIIIVLITFAVRMVLMFPSEPPLNFNEKAILPRIFAQLHR